MADSSSPDNTAYIARELSNKYPVHTIVRENNRSLSTAVMKGFEESKAIVCVVMDADGSHDPREIPRFIDPLLEGAEMVKGSRFAPGGGTTDMPRIRKLGNAGFVLLSNLFFGTTFTDLCYGYHAFWKFCLKRGQKRFD